MTTKNRPFSSHKMDGHYVVLMETSGAEVESWYYFIRWEGNESALRHLEKELNRVKQWYVLDDLSQFDIDLENMVSAQTAKEMGRVELNAFTFHRKFDGKLAHIDFEFRRKDLKDDERMMKRIFNKLGFGKIQDFIDDEDLDDDQVASDYGKSSSSGDESEDSSSSSDEQETRNIAEEFLAKKADPPPAVKSAEVEEKKQTTKKPHRETKTGPVEKPVEKPEESLAK